MAGWGWLVPVARSVFEKLKIPQLIKKFPAFYRTRRFIEKLLNWN
jgi:hypothetical protein